MQTFETNFRQEKEHMKTEPGQSIDSSNRSDVANYLNGKMCSCRNAGKMLPVGVEVMPQQTRTHTHRHTHKHNVLWPCPRIFAKHGALEPALAVTSTV